MTSEEKERLDAWFDAIKHMLKSGDIEQEFYYMNLVSLSYNYAYLGHFSEAARFLSLCDTKYLANTMPKHMLSNKDFFSDAYNLAKVLSEQEQVNKKFNFTCNPYKA